MSSVLHPKELLSSKPLLISPNNTDLMELILIGNTHALNQEKTQLKSPVGTSKLLLITVVTVLPNNSNTEFVPEIAMMVPT